MKRFFIISVVVGLFLVIACVAVSVFAVDRYKRLADKIEMAKRGIEKGVSQGKDITRPFDLLKKAKVSLDAKRIDEGEAFLDEALKLIESPSSKQDITQIFPIDSLREEKCNVFSNPQQVEIEGYEDDCMEPFISRDGKFLFFNNSNSELVDTHIHFAKRIGPLKFQHMGILEGTQSNSKDMAPSSDAAGNFVFTSTRSFAQDGLTIYGGKWTPAELTVKDVHPLQGDMTAPPSWLNMDCDLSPKGELLILAQAEFKPGAGVPTKSDLEMRLKDGAKFRRYLQGDLLLKNVNTPALEYAPALSDDELELYFTRSSLRKQGEKLTPCFRIMLASRSKTTEPFGVPRTVHGSSEGIIEGPTLSLDKKELFFHRKLGDRFVIFRMERSVGQLAK